MTPPWRCQHLKTSIPERALHLSQAGGTTAGPETLGVNGSIPWSQTAWGWHPTYWQNGSSGGFSHATSTKSQRFYALRRESCWRYLVWLASALPSPSTSCQAACDPSNWLAFCTVLVSTWVQLCRHQHFCVVLVVVFLQLKLISFCWLYHISSYVQIKPLRTAIFGNFRFKAIHILGYSILTYTHRCVSEIWGSLGYNSDSPIAVFFSGKMLSDLISPFPQFVSSVVFIRPPLPSGYLT